MPLSNRGVHPDLLDELAPAEPQTEQPPARKREAGAGRAASAPPAQTTEPPAQDAASDLAPSPATDESSPPATAEVPEWFAQAQAAKDPEAMFELLTKNLGPAALTKNERIAGLLGEYSARRAREMLKEQEQARLEQERQAAFQRGDMYTLGQYSAQELQSREEAQKRQAEYQTSPFMTALRRWQEQLPPSVQAEVSGKTFAPEGSLEDGFLAYLDAVTDARRRHDIEELKKSEPGQRKALLSQTVGREVTPEVESGNSNYVREVTDEEIGAMSLDEYDKLFDKNGKPNQGVRVRHTRAIDVRTQQR